MTMSALDAAYHVLREAGRPLHYSEITKRILNQGLWTTTGRTPEATVNARISTDINKRGRSSRFSRVGPGLFVDIITSDSATSSPRGTASNRTLSFTDAAEQILEGEANRQPMHYREITERALEHELIFTRGKTPEATMYAQIFTEIKRSNRRGEQPRFIRYGDGFFGLARWHHQGLISEIEAHNNRVRQKLLEHIQAMGPAEFETIVGELLTAIGFENVEVTRTSGDGGIDVRGTLVVGDVIRTNMAVQVKRWKNNVQAPTVQQVRGSLGAHEQGLIVTTSDFSSGAQAEAERADATPVALMNGRQFVNIMIEQDIAVQRTPLDLLEFSEDGVEAP